LFERQKGRSYPVDIESGVNHTADPLYSLFK
jgi:hypothetical protein